MAQLLRPTSDTGNTGPAPFVGFPSSPTVLFSKVNEAVLDTSNGFGTSGDSDCTMTLAAGIDPGINTGHILHVVADASQDTADGDSFDINLFSGATPIATLSINFNIATPTEETYTLTTVQAAAIRTASGYGSLILAFAQTNTLNLSSCNCYQVWLEIPDAIVDRYYQHTPDSTGKKVDTSELTVGSNTVQRQRMNIVDPTTAAGDAATSNAVLAGTEYGLVERTIVAGDVAAGIADSGKPVKIGGLAKSGLPTILTTGQRANVLHDLYGRRRMLIERPKLLGSYKFESGNLAITKALQSAGSGFVWLINPVGSSVVGYLKKIFVTCVPNATATLVSSPRVVAERITFTGSASGATITPGKRDSTDATNTLTVRTAATGMTITTGAIIGDFTAPSIMTGVGSGYPFDQWLYQYEDGDDLLALRAGEGIAFRQPDAGSGTSSDGRLLLIFGSWEER